MKQIQGKLVLLRVTGEFELPRVRVIGVQLYLYLSVQYDCGILLFHGSKTQQWTRFKTKLSEKLYLFYLREMRIEI